MVASEGEDPTARNVYGPGQLSASFGSTTFLRRWWFWDRGAWYTTCC